MSRPRCVADALARAGVAFAPCSSVDGLCGVAENPRRLCAGESTRQRLYAFAFPDTQTFRPTGPLADVSRSSPEQTHSGVVQEGVPKLYCFVIRMETEVGGERGVGIERGWRDEGNGEGRDRRADLR